MITKKILFGAGISIVAVVSSFAFVAAADTPTATTASQQAILQVGPAGKVLLRGTIDSVSTGTITVKSWGGEWIVNVSSTTQVLPATTNNDITQFKAGDFIGVQGTVSQSSSWTIDSTLVRDWTSRAQAVQEKKQNQQSAQQTIKSLTPKNYQGTVSGASGSSFTLSVEGTTYVVNVASSAQVVNKNWLNLPVANIQNGDTVRIWGINANGTITAQIVRDVSIPK